jgi:glycosyltransferase involved in cell wall biosynthesis
MPESRKLRIAVWYNLPSGGALRALNYQVRGLLDRGHTLEAWKPTDDSKESDLMSIGAMIPEHQVPVTEEAVSRGSYIDRIKQSLSEQERTFEAMERHSAICSEEMTREGFDVLLAHSCRIYNTPFIGRHVAGTKVLYLHEPSRALYEAGRRSLWRTSLDLSKSKSVRRKLSAIFRDYLYVRDLRARADLDYLNAAAFDEILVNSFYTRECVLRAYNLESRVCYLGIDTELFRSLERPRESFVMGVGGIAPNKNIEFVIDAIGTIEATRRPKLKWVGQSAIETYRDELIKRAVSLGVDLELIVCLSDEDLVEQLNRASVFVYAPRLEPFGLAPLEANACGLPVVAIREAGMRESIIPGFNGFLVENNPVDMGERVSYLMENPKMSREMGNQAAIDVQKTWTWRRSIDLLEDRLISNSKS